MINSVYRISIKEKFLLFLERTLDNLLKIEAFQRYVNRKANSKYGSKFVTTHVSEIDDVFSDYHFNDIQKNDIVLDIGSNAGAFALFVSKFVKHIYAIEPITFEILKNNIELNNRKNISVLPIALGKGTITLKWTGYNDKTIETLRLWQIIELCDGRIDFLKCDCEGGEWSIEPWELEGIRRIEIEVHNFDETHNLNDFLNVLDKANFEYGYTSPRHGILIIHARKLNK